MSVNEAAIERRKLEALRRHGFGVATGCSAPSRRPRTWPGGAAAPPEPGGPDRGAGGVDDDGGDAAVDQCRAIGASHIEVAAGVHVLRDGTSRWSPTSGS